MKYFKFFGKCILAALPIIGIIAFIALFPDMYMDEEYPAWKFSKAVVAGDELEGKNFDTVILGDSGAMSSLIPQMLSDSTVNLAVGGGTTIEAYYFMKEYLKNHEKPKNVIVMFAPFHYYTIDNYATRTIYFKTLSVEDARQLYGIAKGCGISSIYNKDVIMSDIYCRMNLPTQYLPALTASKFVGRYRANTDAYNELVMERGYGSFGTADGCDAVSYESSQDSIYYGEDFNCIITYLENLYWLCAGEGINMTLIQPALNEASYQALQDGYVNDYKNILEISKQVMTTATVETELRCYPNEYFGDVSHLNRKGAEIFTREIKETYPDLFE